MGQRGFVRAVLAAALVLALAAPAAAEIDALTGLDKSKAGSWTFNDWVLYCSVHLDTCWDMDAYLPPGDPRRMPKPVYATPTPHPRFVCRYPAVPVYGVSQCEDDIAVTVPDNGYNGTGLTLTIPVNPGVDMGAGTLLGPLGAQFLRYFGQLPAVAVNDSRPGLLAWSVAGHLTAFTDGASFIPGRLLGWTPAVSSPGAGAIAGPGTLPGVGIESADLAHALDGHGGIIGAQAVLGAALFLDLPTNTAAGAYGATLTLTALG